MLSSDLVAYLNVEWVGEEDEQSGPDPHLDHVLVHITVAHNVVEHFCNTYCRLVK